MVINKQKEIKKTTILSQANNSTLSLIKKDFKIIDSNIEIYYEGNLTGIITDVPPEKLEKINQVTDLFNDVHELLIGINEVKYENLLQLSDLIEYAELKTIEKTICLFVKEKIMAVVVDNADIFENIPSLIIVKSIAYYFAHNDFKPYMVDGNEIMHITKDLNY